MRRLKEITVALGCAVMQAAASPLWAQCAMCRESLKSGGTREMITGYMYSTLLLTTMPILIVSTFGFLFYRAYRHQQRLTVGAIDAPAGGDNVAEGPPVL